MDRRLSSSHHFLFILGFGGLGGGAVVQESAVRRKYRLMAAIRIKDRAEEERLFKEAGPRALRLFHEEGPEQFIEEIPYSPDWAEELNNGVVRLHYKHNEEDSTCPSS